MHRFFSMLSILLLLLSSSGSVWAGDEHDHKVETPGRSLSNNAVNWPTFQKFVDTVTLRDYNTRIVFLGTLLLGFCAAMVGTFMLLRKRALMGDVVGHATLPGVGVAFIVMEFIKPDTGQWLPGLLIGAFIAAMCGIGATTLIRRFSRIKEDTAMAIVLSIFFGLGVVLFSIVQDIPSGGVAGIKSFIYGKTGSIKAADVRLIGGVALAAGLLVMILFKEFTLLCFDEGFAATQGYATLLLDLCLMMLVALVAVIGLQSVGLLLVVALLLIPPAAARFWTDSLHRLTLLAVIFGGIGSSAGVLISAMSKAPPGPTIVLVGAVIFIFSLFLGTRRGALRRLLIHLKLRARLKREHLLQACYQWLEAVDLDLRKSFTSHDLAELRSWSPRELSRLLRSASKRGLLQSADRVRFQFTARGFEEANRVIRNHRLWEAFLTEHAEIATGQVDHHAYRIDDVLDTSMVRKLEAKLAAQQSPAAP